MTQTTELAGRELDEAVGRRVMALTPCEAWGPYDLHLGGALRECPCEHENGRCWPASMWPPEYTSDVGAAWAVVEALRARCDGDPDFCRVWHRKIDAVLAWAPRYASSEVAAAICRAALAACEARAEPR